MGRKCQLNVWRRDEYPDICHALLQLMIFRRRHWRRRREDGKDEGNEREEHPGELIHGDVQVCKGRKVARVVLRENREQDTTEEIPSRRRNDDARMRCFYTQT
jgi:hypothetical protein